MREFARWNPARDLWETETMGLLCGHSDVFSETWPSSGMTRAGMAYALPTWEQRTDAGESSSSPLLPTATSRDYKGVRSEPATPGLLLPEAIQELTTGRRFQLKT